MKYLPIFLLFTFFVMACNSNEQTTIDLSDFKRTNSGYAYEFHEDVDGEPAQVGDLATFHLIQRFDDTIFFNSHDQKRVPTMVMPQLAALPNDPAPYEELLYLMSPGDSASVYYNLDSLPRKSPAMEGRKHLIYDIRLVSLENLTEKKNAIATEASDLLNAYKNNTLENVQTTDSGLKYAIIKEGTGKDADKGRMVSIDYYGMLAENGTAFDDSYSRGQPIEFPLGKGSVIEGWEEGIDLLKKGDKAIFFIPAELGYGSDGNLPVIPADADLAFLIELKDVQ